MRRFISILVGSALLCTSAMAQNGSTTGLIFDRDILSAPSLYSLSQRDYVGTARSMAMGGAFTSLGADLASFGINPAGFGMYQRNEVSVTLGLGIRNSKNSGVLNADRGNNSTTQFSVNNIGASFRIFESTGNLVAVNLAFGYNKVADYNYDFNYHGTNSGFSAADAFADIANREGLLLNADNHICDAYGNADYDMNAYFWSTALAYKGGLINRGSNGWYPDEIGSGASIDQFTRMKSRGSAGEFSIAVGFNINNIVYLGASLDIQSISRKQTIYYNEYINYAEGEQPDPTAYPYQLQQFEFGQSMYVDGSGVGAKFGVVVRPVEALRIGFAVHTPTYYSLAYRYTAALSSVALNAGDNPNGWEVINGSVYADEATPTLQDGGEHRWAFTTPTRLLVGASYTIGQYAVVSVDYQYDAYRALKLNYSPADTGYTNDTFRGNLKGVHTVRAGVETKPLPWLALRVGGGYRSKVLNKDYDFVAFSEPIADKLWYVSAGIGFRLSKVTSMDLAYQYRNTRYSDYYSFHTNLGNVANASPLYGLDLINHNIALTFAFRF